MFCAHLQTSANPLQYNVEFYFLVLFLCGTTNKLKYGAKYLGIAYETNDNPSADTSTSMINDLKSVPTIVDNS